MDTGNSILQGSEEEVRGAISAFEEILHAMPNDRVALETLFEGYLMLNNQEKAADYLGRLTQTILEEDDMTAAAELLPALHQHAGVNPEIATILNHVETKLGNTPSAPDTATTDHVQEPTAEAPPPLAGPSYNANDITAELSMAWNIHQASVFDEEEYSAVVHDLSELCSRDLNVPVTVLHVLEDRHSASLERVLEFLVKDSNTPFVKLSRFDMSPFGLKKNLPEDFARQKGAIVFEEMEGDSMVAVLNPYDQNLTDSIHAVLGPRVHFFLTTSSEYDAAVAKIFPQKNSLDEKKSNDPLALDPEDLGKKSSLRTQNILIG